MTTPRSLYKVTRHNPGSDVTGETAVASMVFKPVDPEYSAKLLETTKKGFSFADTYKGNYSVSLAFVVCPFYYSIQDMKRSFSGHQHGSTGLLKTHLSQLCSNSCIYY